MTTNLDHKVMVVLKMMETPDGKMAAVFVDGTIIWEFGPIEDDDAFDALIQDLKDKLNCYGDKQRLQ